MLKEALVSGLLGRLAPPAGVVEAPGANESGRRPARGDMLAMAPGAGRQAPDRARRPPRGRGASVQPRTGSVADGRRLPGQDPAMRRKGTRP